MSIDMSDDDRLEKFHAEVDQFRSGGMDAAAKALKGQAIRNIHSMNNPRAVRMHTCALNSAQTTYFNTLNRT